MSYLKIEFYITVELYELRVCIIVQHTFEVILFSFVFIEKLFSKYITQFANPIAMLQWFKAKKKTTEENHFDFTIYADFFFFHFFTRFTSSSVAAVPPFSASNTFAFEVDERKIKNIFLEKSENNNS